MPRYPGIALLLGLILVPCAYAAEGSEGIDFAISRSTTGFWEKSRHHLANDWVRHLPDDNNKLEYIAITYTLTNKNENRKLDLGEGFEFFLQDEFGNTYRRIKKPAGYSEPVILVAKNFPSLYPGESYGETLFFEAPLAKASRLTLVIDANAVGIKEKISLAVNKHQQPSLPPNKVAASQPPDLTAQPIQTAQQSSSREPVFSPVQENRCPIIITSPENGATLDVTRPVRIQVSIEREQIPDHILITGPGFSASDPSPRNRNTYDFMIPPGQPAGIQVINVAAEWSDTSTRLPGCADNIFVYIDNPSSTGAVKQSPRDQSVI